MGQGSLLTGVSVCHQALRDLELAAADCPGTRLTLKVHPSVRDYFLEEGRQALEDLERSIGMSVTVKADPNLHPETAAVETGRADPSTGSAGSANPAGSAGSGNAAGSGGSANPGNAVNSGNAANPGASENAAGRDASSSNPLAPLNLKESQAFNETPDNTRRNSPRDSRGEAVRNTRDAYRYSSHGALEAAQGSPDALVRDPLSGARPRRQALKASSGLGSHGEDHAGHAGHAGRADHAEPDDRPRASGARARNLSDREAGA
jgi:hypothetical protein